MNYLIGKCQVELRDFANAHDAFNNAIQVSLKVDVDMKEEQRKGGKDEKGA